MPSRVAYNSVSDSVGQFGAAKWASFGLDFGFDFTRPRRERYVVYVR